MIGETTVLSERSVGDACDDLESWKFLKPDGAWMTDCGSSAEPDRVLEGSWVTILCTRSCTHQSSILPLEDSIHTLVALSGLVISMSGDSNSPVPLLFTLVSS